MKKADLLSKLATLLAATDHIPDDADIKSVFFSPYGLGVSIETKDFLPPGEVQIFKPDFLNLEGVESFGVMFQRRIQK